MAGLTSKEYQQWLKLVRDVEEAPTAAETIRAMAALKEFKTKHGL